MSRSARPWIRPLALLLGAIGVVAMGWVSLVQILHVDAFAKFQGEPVPYGAEVGVTMTDFSMKAYEKGRLAALADVDKVEVRRDRSLFEMSGVRDGLMIDKEGNELQFDMPDATYHYFRNRLTSEAGAHIKNDDFDINSDRFVYQESNSTLQVDGGVKGTLAGGKVQALSVTINTATREVSGRDLHWIGEIDDPVQDGQRKQWDIVGESWKTSSDGKTQTYTKARATDGEVIVIADTVEYTKDTDVLVAKGNVKYFGVDANMLCDEATVFRKERRSVFAGTVRMVVKSEDDEKVVEGEFPTIERVTPESLKTNPQGATQEQVDRMRDADNLRKYPIKVIADRIEYWYKKGERRATITGSPFARQDLQDGWRHAWANEAFYDGEKETLTMKSRAGQLDARVIMSIGDDYRALDVTISTKEGDKSFSGHNVKATVFVDDDEVPTRTGGGTTGGSTGGG